MSDLERLVELQEIDSALDHSAYRRSHLPERIHHRELAAATTAARAALTRNLERRAALDSEYSALEAHGSELDTKIARLEGQMRNVVVTREAEAIQREIGLLRSERDADDERGLLVLEENEQLATEAAALQEQIDAASIAEADAAAALAVADATLDREVAELADRRTATAADVPSALLAEYDTRSPAFAGVAVARLQGTRCTGCHLDLSRVEIEALRAVPGDVLPECPQCARILVR